MEYARGLKTGDKESRNYFFGWEGLCSSLMGGSVNLYICDRHCRVKSGNDDREVRGDCKGRQA